MDGTFQHFRVELNPAQSSDYLFVVQSGHIHLIEAKNSSQIIIFQCRILDSIPKFVNPDLFKKSVMYEIHYLLKLDMFTVGLCRTQVV